MITVAAPSDAGIDHLEQKFGFMLQRAIGELVQNQQLYGPVAARHPRRPSLITSLDQLVD